VAAARQARAGIPISVKLILATSIVIAAAVFTATWFSQTSINDLTERSIAARRESGMKSIVRESELVVGAVASAVALPLSESKFGGIAADVLEPAIKVDQESDKRVQWLIVADTAGAIVAATKGAPTSTTDLQRLLKDGQTSNGVSRANVKGSEWVYGAPVVLAGPQGTVLMGVTTAGLEAELTKALDEAKQRSTATRNRVWMVGLVVLAIGIVLAALQGVRLAAPIKVLTRQAERIAAGDLSQRVPLGRRDELGVLAGAFNFMTGQIQHLLVEQAQKASLEKEMSLARQVQQAMLPPETLDEHGNLKVVGYCMPASSCGGDWWTYRKLSNGRMLLVVGDATGHGIHSAMIAATARGAVEALSGIDERLLTPEQVLRAIDSAIRQVGDHNVLMTAFAAVFDSSNGILHYANAGQNFPYVIKLGATRVLEEASIIAASGNPLGDRNIAVEIRRGSLQLRPGDLFVCFTDGLVERANPAGKLFGDRRLRGALTGQKIPDGRALIRLRDQVIQIVERYAEGAVAEDDITFVLCQFDPPAVHRSSAGRGAA
jgi:serine phosphatase RsbU (regulator of sigma subunit)